LLPVSGSYGYDWSPEGTWIVYTATGPEIWVADAYAGGSGEWLCDGYGPRWSPVLEDDSTLIAFAIGSWGNTEIRTINPNGASPPTPVVAMGKNRTIKGDSIYWSPMGTHLVYTRIQSNNNSYNVYRVGADGSDPTNLTNDLKENAFSIGWRD
jgi:Tol biopolymer transport system component